MQNNKPTILFLAKFFITYFFLLGIYSFYLNRTQIREQNLFTCAPITKDVAEQSAKIMHFLGYDTKIVQHNKELSFKVLVNNKYVSRVIEGCNSVSVIILFIAFIIAFKGSFRDTIWFGILGSFLIYIVNLLRIAVLSVGLYKYPEQESLLHDFIFPIMVYGMVFLLWILWVNKFSNYAKK